MVRCFALFAMLLSVPALADAPPAPPKGAVARAEVTVTILRGEEIGQLERPKRTADGDRTAIAPPDRHYQHLPSDQIRIDFY